LLLVLAVQAAAVSDCNLTTVWPGSRVFQQQQQQQQQQCSPHETVWSATEAPAAQAGLYALLKTRLAVQQHSQRRCRFSLLLRAQRLSRNTSTSTNSSRQHMRLA
jgi:hypothetical protein